MSISKCIYCDEHYRFDLDNPSSLCPACAEVFEFTEEEQIAYLELLWKMPFEVAR